MFALPNTLGHCRLGVTVTRKVGSAVRRNRVKRVLREIFRCEHRKLRVAMDLVVNAHPEILSAGTERVRTDLLACIGRLQRDGS